MFNEQDQFWMEHALSLAKKAAEVDEVPVAAVIVKNNTLISAAHNSPISLNDPTAHAEILAMRHAAQVLQNYRLIDCTLYVTLEPCTMCSGAIIHARIKRLVFASYDEKAGAVCSCASLLDTRFANHKVDYQGGLLAQECSQVLSHFFVEKRKLQRLANGG